MDDFTLSMSGGFPSQEVIVGGDYSLGDLSPDISHFVNEEVIFEDIDSGLTSSPASSTDEINVGSFSNESNHEDDVINVSRNRLCKFRF